MTRRRRLLIAAWYPAATKTTKRFFVLFVAVAAFAGSASFGSGPRAQVPSGQVFRSTADLVTVNVSVRTGGAKVGGLKASDFVLLDNGVAQRIESLEMEAVPADITILVDAGEDMADYVGSLNSQVQKIATLARPDDRLRIVAMDTYVREILPMQRAAERGPLGKLSAAGLASVNDTLAAALMSSVDPNRQHLVIALTDGVDAMSTLTDTTVREIARQSSATLHVAQVTVTIEADPPLPPLWSTTSERQPHFLSTVPPARYWRRFHEPPHEPGDRFAVLRETARATGGDLHIPGIFTDRTAAGIFKKVYDDYRQNYVLRYTPTGVKREGWHDITVKSPAYPSYTINARRGYAIEAPSPAAGRASAPVGRPANIPRTRAASLEAVVAAYGRNDFAAAQAAIRDTADRARLIRDFRAGGNPWPAAPHREAVLVLELAEAAFGAHKDDAREAARDLLAAYSRLVRHPLAPDAFERDWLAAELAVLEGSIKPALADSFVTSALERFPDEPRFLLARATVSDQLWPLGRLSDLDGGPPPRIDVVIAQYDAAIKYPETAVEASVRKAWFLHRLGREEEALSLLDAAGGRSLDVDVTYLRHLFRGHVLDALQRLDAAIAEYREALALVPNAQSARVALMNGLQRRGNTADARALAGAIQTTASAPLDPWWMYWYGDYRLLPAMLTSLREQVK